MTHIAELLHRVARGKHGTRDLSRDEARTMFAALLRPDADVLQLGAFLIAERMKGETAPELAGFVDAVRSRIKGFGACNAPEGAIDLPCYAGKRRAPPLHLLAALQARDAGIPVFVHGVEGIEGRVSAWQALQRAGVKRAGRLQHAVEILAGEGMVYMDASDICPDLFRILQLRPRLGVRSFSHTVVRLLNPLACTGQMNGVFHTPYALRMAEANALLQQQRSLLFTGAEGEPELYASRQKSLLLQQQGGIQSLRYEDADCEAYPKEIINNIKSLYDYIHVVDNVDTEQREATVLQRMHEAFRLVSNGDMPETWCEG